MITVLQRAEVERARARRIVARAHANAHANAVVAARARHQIGSPLVSPGGSVLPPSPQLQQSMSAPGMSPTTGGGGSAADLERRRHDFAEYHRQSQFQDHRMTTFAFDGGGDGAMAGVGAVVDERGGVAYGEQVIQVPTAAPAVVEGAGGAAMNMGGGSGGGEGAKSSAAIVANGPVSASNDHSADAGGDGDVCDPQHGGKKRLSTSGVLEGGGESEESYGSKYSLGDRHGKSEHTAGACYSSESSELDAGLAGGCSSSSAPTAAAVTRLAKDSFSSSSSEGLRTEAGGGGSVGEIPSEPGVGDNPAGSGGGVVPSEGEVGGQLTSGAAASGSVAGPLGSSGAQVVGGDGRGMGRECGFSGATGRNHNGMGINVAASVNAASAGGPGGVGVQQNSAVMGGRAAGYGPQLQPQPQQQQQVLQLPQAVVAPAQHSVGMNADLFHMKHMEMTLSQEEVERADLRCALVVSVFSGPIMSALHYVHFLSRENGSDE